MIDQPASPLLAGLSHVDFYWRSQIVSEAPDGTEQVSNGVQQKTRRQVDTSSASRVRRICSSPAA